jgi:hypothetical protein
MTICYILTPEWRETEGMADPVGDVIVLLAAAVLTLAAIMTAALMARAARRRRALAEASRPARLKAEADYLDRYVRRLDQAAADADLDRLETERKSRKWDGS